MRVLFLTSGSWSLVVDQNVARVSISESWQHSRFYFVHKNIYKREPRCSGRQEMFKVPFSLLFVSKRTNDFQTCLGAILDLLSTCSQCFRSTYQNWSRLFFTQLVKLRLIKKNNFKMISSIFNFIDEHKMILYLCIGLYWNHPCHYRFLKLHALKEQRISYAWLYVLHFNKPIQASFAFLL